MNLSLFILIIFIALPAFAANYDFSGTYVSEYRYDRERIFKRNCNDINTLKMTKIEDADAFEFKNGSDNTTLVFNWIFTCIETDGTKSVKVAPKQIKQTNASLWKYSYREGDEKNYWFQTVKFSDASIRSSYIRINGSMEVGSGSCNSTGACSGTSRSPSLFLVKYSNAELPDYGIGPCGLHGALKERLADCAKAPESNIANWKLISRDSGGLREEAWLSPSGILFFWAHERYRHRPGDNSLYKSLKLKELEPFEWINVFNELLINPNAELSEFKELLLALKTDRIESIYDGRKYCVEEPENGNKSMLVKIDLSIPRGFTSKDGGCGGYFDNSGYWYFTKLSR